MPRRRPALSLALSPWGVRNLNVRLFRLVYVWHGAHYVWHGAHYAIPHQLKLSCHTLDRLSLWRHCRYGATPALPLTGLLANTRAAVDWLVGQHLRCR